MAQNVSKIQWTTEELDLIDYVWQAESFRDTAWDRYGQEWIYHVPSRINAFTYFYFGVRLFPYQLAWYYCPVPEGTIHGGRGCGKTEGIGVADITYAALHPGEDHLWVSITKDQSRKAFDAILRLGSADGRNPRFLERFVDDWVSMPFPDIRLKRWDDNDTGVIARYRGIGDESIEKLRSYEAGTLQVDEAFREVESETTYGMLRGCIRGPNRYKFKTVLTPEQQVQVDDRLYALTMIDDPEERDLKEAEIWDWLRQIGCAKRGFMCLMGNAGPHKWAWSRHKRARTEPEHYWSYVATSWDNPYFGKREREALERQFQDDEEQLEVEMMAREPRSLGSVFKRRQIDQCCDKTLLPYVSKMVSKAHEYEEQELPVPKELQGFYLGKHPEMGVYQYGVPPQKGHWHVISGDPGTGIAPLRNCWVVLVWDVSELPVTLVYFEMGYLFRRQIGDYNGFLARLKWAEQIYATQPGDIWVESTGPQKGMVMLAYPESLRVTPVTFQAKKLEYINQAVQLMANRMVCFPEIEIFLTEHGNYEYKDQDLAQDVVMANICAAAGIWRYYQPDQEWEVSGETESIEVEYDRFARPRPHSPRRRTRFGAAAGA